MQHTRKRKLAAFVRRKVGVRHPKATHHGKTSLALLSVAHVIIFSASHGDQELSQRVCRLEAFTAHSNFTKQRLVMQLRTHEAAYNYGRGRVQCSQCSPNNLHQQRQTNLIKVLKERMDLVPRTWRRNPSIAHAVIEVTGFVTSIH